MAKPETDVGRTVFVNNSRSVFHGLKGEVLEIESIGQCMSKVRVDRGARGPMDVWFLGSELRFEACALTGKRRNVIKVEEVDEHDTRHAENWLRPSQMVCGVTTKWRLPVLQISDLTCERCILRILRTGQALGWKIEEFSQWSLADMTEVWTLERAARDERERCECGDEEEAVHGDEGD